MKRSQPDFLVIGPEKTGTSWLYEALSNHPEVKLLPVKEILYFWERFAYPNETIISRFWPRGDWHSIRYRSYLSDRIKSILAHPRTSIKDKKRLAWDLKYLLFPRNDRWYKSLYQDIKLTTGDFSPQYFSLPQPEIQKVCQLLPDSKVILSLRDPIDWTWSFVRMNLLGKSSLSDVSASEIVSHCDEYIERYPSIGNINKWTEVIKTENVKVLFFDELVTRPMDYLNEVCQFLGISALESVEEAILFEPVNLGRPVGMPAKYERYLASRYEPILIDLAKTYPHYPVVWLERARDIIARNHGNAGT